MKRLFPFFIVLTVLVSLFAASSSVFAAAFNITSPQYNASVNKENLNITWESAPGSIGYKVSVKDISAGKYVIENQEVSGTSYTLTASQLESGHSYKITVASTAADKTDSYATSSFSVSNLKPMQKAKITSPSSGTTLPAKDITVTWNGVPNAQNYKVTLIDLSSGTSSFNTSVKQTTCKIPASVLKAGRKYSIKVTASASGYADSSTETTITVAGTPQGNSGRPAGPLPEHLKPKITYPSNNAKLNYADFTVKWTGNSSTDKYKVQVIDKTTNKTVASIDAGKKTECLISKSNLLGDHTYILEVSGIFNGVSVSSSLNFFVRKPALPNPVIINPSKNPSEIGKADITITWKSVPGAQSYKFALRDLNTNKLIVDGKILTQTSYKVTKDQLIEGHKYRFAVGAFAPGSIDSGSWTESIFTVINGQTQNAMVQRAEEMLNVKWRPAKDLRKWRSGVFTAGTDYIGVAYSQTWYYQKSGEEFKKSLEEKKDFYENFSVKTYKGEIVACPKYGNDCSGFVSFAWGISRQSTYSMFDAFEKKDASFKSMWGRLEKVGPNDFSLRNPSKEHLYAAYDHLKTGDALLNNGHVMFFYKKVEGSKDQYIVYEQTPPKAKITIFTKSTLADKKYVPVRLKQ
ncbi:MAG: hypothetical protein N2645_24115 [Clostridia bacterium]|nr:hypothetical protein [Clostridia bacterium]